jgi:DNA-binding beta-propeller fold protein YncE
VTGEAANRILRPLALDCLAYPAGIAVGPRDAAVFVAEQAANRVLRFVQRPAGVWHATVFHTFSGRMGPSALAWDDARGLLYVVRGDLPELAAAGIVSVLNAEGGLVREIVVPGPEVSGVALAPDGSHLVVADATSNALHRVPL